MFWYSIQSLASKQNGGDKFERGLRNKLKGYFIFFKTVSRETEESINLGRKVLGRCFLKSCKGQKTQRG